MKLVFRMALWAFVIALLVSPAAAWAAPQYGQGQGQQPPPPPKDPPAAPAAQPGVPATPPVNKEEEDSYKAFYEMKTDDAEVVIRSAEEFLKKFPESRYRESVYSRLTQAYFNVQQLDKLIVAAEKGLELNPDNVDILSLLSHTMLRRFNPSDLDAGQKLQKAETISKHAIELLGKIPKPAQVTEEDFARAKNEKLSMCHSGLGLVYFYRQRFADAAAAFEQATTVASNPDDFYLLGVMYEQLRRPADAATAYGRCGETPWAWQDRCKQGAEKNKKLAGAQPAAPAPAPKP